MKYITSIIWSCLLMFSVNWCFGQTFSVSSTNKVFTFPASSMVGYTTVTMTNLTNNDLNMRWKIDLGKGLPTGWTADFQVADSIYTGVLDSADFILDTIKFNHDQIVLFCFPNNYSGSVNAKITLIDLNDPNPQNKVDVNFTISGTYATNTTAVSLKDRVKLFPNPTRGKVNFGISDDLVVHSCTILNSVGQVVLEEQLMGKNNIDIERFNNGLYYLILDTDKGKIEKRIFLQKGR